MALPSLKSLKSDDLDRMYAPDLPWVESATASGVAGSFYVRMAYPVIDYEGQKMKRNDVRAKVRKADWALPDVNKTVKIGSVSYVVAEVMESGSLEWELKLETNVKMGFGR